MEDVVELVVEDSKATVVEAVEGANATMDLMIHLHVIAVGCVAIWPVTVPKIHNHKEEVAMLCLSEEEVLNPGSKALEDEEADAQSVSVV